MPAHNQDLSQAAIQTLFVSARAWDVTALLRELKSVTGKWQEVSLEAFVLGLFDISKKLPSVGLKLTIEGGRADLSTSEIKESSFNIWLRDFNPSPEGRFSASMMEALSIVTLKQPVTASEIEKLCQADRRDALQRLEALGWIERRAGQNRAYSYVTTPQFVARFGQDAIQKIRDTVHTDTHQPPK